MNGSQANPAAAVLQELRRRGIAVRPAGDRLLYRPRSAMTTELLAQVVTHKPELLALLRTSGEWCDRAYQLLETCADENLRSDLRDHFEETAATLEYQQNHERAHAEELAFGQLMFRILELGAHARSIP